MVENKISVEKLLNQIEDNDTITDKNKIIATNILSAVSEMERHVNTLLDEIYDDISAPEAVLKEQKLNFLTQLSRNIKQVMYCGLIPDRRTISACQQAVITRMTNADSSVSMQEILKREWVPFFSSRTKNVLVKLMDAAPINSISLQSSTKVRICS